MASRIHFILIHLLFVLLVCQPTAAQKPVIKNLVFEGAGMRGIAYCGVLEELETQGLVKDVEKVAGTSAGALMAMTVALGYTSGEIKKIIGSTNFKKLNDGRFFVLGGINRLKNNYGWYRGERMSKWIGEIIKTKTGDPEISFEEWNRRGYKDLQVVATCLNKQRLVYFSATSHPKMKVRDAVRISMSIPLYFGAVYIDSIGNVVNAKHYDPKYDIMVDGGFTGNFPIRIFDTNGQPNPHTLGFRIDREDQIIYDKLDQKLAPRTITNFNDYLSAFHSMIIENLNRQPLTSADWKRTVSISDGDVTPRIRKLSSKEINTLLTNGKEAMKLYLN